MHDILREIAAVVVSLGGRLSSLLEIHERQGKLSGHARGPLAIADVRDPLIVLPAAAMPSVDAGDWTWIGNRLGVVTNPEVKTPTKSLLELHAELYSATGKPIWYRTSHPRAATAAEATLKAIRSLRPYFHMDPSPMGFLATRTFKSGEHKVPSLIPLADALNHHRRGAPLGFRSGHLTVVRRQPTDTKECFVNYGLSRRDPLDLALHYGYADSDVAVATSAPVVVEVAELGSIEVSRQPLQKRSPIDPPTIERTPDGLRLSHLMFQAQSPQWLLAPLTMIASAVGVAAPESVARELLGAVIDRNLALLDDLGATLDPATAMGAMLTQACRYQAQIFSDFWAAIA